MSVLTPIVKSASLWCLCWNFVTSRSLWKAGQTFLSVDNLLCRVAIRSSQKTLRGAMVKILDVICWNVTSKHQFWIQILLIYNAYLLTSKENTVSQRNYGQIEVEWMHYLSGRFTFKMSEHVSIMLHFELLQS